MARDEDITIWDCPRCGGKMIRRSGRFGDFLGCSNYPQCKETMRIEKEDLSNGVKDAASVWGY